MAGICQDSIKNIKKGNQDSSDNKIINVLVKHNEIAIYEIEDKDINNRLKVLIDGYDESSESNLVERFNTVKQKYIKAKSLLYRSSNFGMMKNRIAHLLSTIFTTLDTDFDGNGEFQKLIDEIEEEYSKSIKHRLIYLLPAILISMIIGLYMYNVYSNDTTKPEIWEILCVIFGSILGGTMSIIFRVNQKNFEEYTSWLYYAIIGIERIILSIFAGAIAYIGIKSGILFGNIDNKGFWIITAIAILAGFSEALIPSLLKKASSDKLEN